MSDQLRRYVVAPWEAYRGVFDVAQHEPRGSVVVGAAKPPYISAEGNTKLLRLQRFTTLSKNKIGRAIAPVPTTYPVWLRNYLTMFGSRPETALWA